jgi:hypothetical protein
MIVGIESAQGLTRYERGEARRGMTGLLPRI